MEAVVKRQVPEELLIYEHLTRRKKLTDKQQKQYIHLKKGFEGEKLFCQMAENTKGNGLILNDLWFEHNQTAFQIDCLIIVPDKIYLYEVKNYEGDFYYEADKFYKKPRLEILNPLHQLSRTESLLRQLLLSLGYHTPINAFVAFVNPAFILYQAPVDKPIIFSTQINRHLQSLSSAAPLNSNNQRLARKLLEMNRSSSLFQQLPTYEYDELNKGIICPFCNTISVTVIDRTCVCTVCGKKESVTEAVLRTVKEFQLLFPNRKLTTSQIHDWCKVVESKKVIRKILADNFKVVGAHRWAYYV